MRSAVEISDIVNRAKLGYVLLQQKLPARRRLGYYTYEENRTVYELLREGKILLFAIQFSALSLKEMNLLADRLVRLGFVANVEATVEYIQPAYNSSITLIER